MNFLLDNEAAIQSAVSPPHQRQSRLAGL